MARRSLAAAAAAVVLGVTLGSAPAASGQSRDADAVVVVGEDATATVAAVQAAGGQVRSVLHSVGGAAALLTEREAAVVEAAGLDVVADASARVTSDGFGTTSGADGLDLRVQVAALNPMAAW